MLKRFLYQPVLTAIDVRDQKIAAHLLEANTTQAEAEKLRVDFQRKNDEFEQQRQHLLAAATEEVQTERERLLESARQEAETLRTKLLASVQGERQGLSQQLAERAQQEVLHIARKLLADLADVGLDERMASVFVQQYQALQSQQKDALAGGAAVLRSSWPLPPARQAALQETLGPLHFEVRPELICGLELTSNGHKLSWNIADYLGSLAKAISEPAHAS